MAFTLKKSHIFNFKIKIYVSTNENFSNKIRFIFLKKEKTMTKKEYEQAEEKIRNAILEAKGYKLQDEVEKLAGLLQLADEDPLAKATIESNNGFACDLSSTEDSIETYEELDNVSRCSCGMAGGFGNMIYYKNTCAFFDEHKNLILEKLEEESFGLGYANGLESINKFQCFKDENITLQDMMTIDKEKGECEDFKHTQIKNALAWYAGEQTAYAFNTLIESKEFNPIKPEYLKTAENRMINYVNNRVNRLNRELSNLKIKYENENARGM